MSKHCHCKPRKPKPYIRGKIKRAALDIALRRFAVIEDAAGRHERATAYRKLAIWNRTGYYADPPRRADQP